MPGLEGAAPVPGPKPHLRRAVWAGRIRGHSLRVNRRAWDRHGHCSRDWRVTGASLIEVPRRQVIKLMSTVVMASSGVITREAAIAVCEKQMDLGLRRATPNGSREPKKDMGPQKVMPKAPGQPVSGELSASHDAILRLLTSGISGERSESAACRG